MGWLYKRSLGGFKSPAEYLDNQFTHTGERHSFRVLKSALVRRKRYFAAVERVDRGSGERLVFAVVCLVDYRPRSTTGHVFGYKDMEESSEPGEYDCPAAILDLLTPSALRYANVWRQRCRERLAKAKLRAGQVLAFRTPLRFSDGALLSRFSVVPRKVGRRTRLLLQGDNGGFYRISNLKDRDYTVGSSESVAPAAQATECQLPLFSPANLE